VNKNEFDADDIMRSTKNRSKEKTESATIETNWTRNCPKCQKKIVHKNRHSYRTSVRTLRICISCKMVEQQARIKASKPTPIYARTCPLCNAEIIYANKWGMSVGCRKNRKCRSCTNKEIAKIRIFSHEHLSFLRKSYLDVLRKRKGQLTPNYNFRACIIFDEINRELGWNGQHAENGGEKFVDGYWVDYYEPTLNLVIEYDERHHNYQKDDDIKRQQDIIAVLKCKFIRIHNYENWRDIINETTI